MTKSTCGILVLLTVAFLTGCNEKPITSPFVSHSHNAPQTPDNPHFSFLPPLAPQRPSAGKFDASYAAEVRVCVVVADRCSSTVAAWSPQQVSVSGGQGHYSINWDIPKDLPEGRYRIRVIANRSLLGQIDVSISDSPAGSPAFKRGQTLPIKFRIEEGAVPNVDGVIVGATRLDLVGYAAVSFDINSLPSAHAIKLLATSNEETAEDYENTLPIQSSYRAPWELRINTGNARPATAARIEVQIPSAFAAALPSGFVPSVWIQTLTSEEHEVLDIFELATVLSATIDRIVAEVPPAAFTDARDGSFEAIVILGVKPAGISSRMIYAAADPSCRLSSLLPPVTPRDVSSAFNAATHKGTDYVAGYGDVVAAAGDGNVERIGWDVRRLAKPDARSGLTIKGWGRYVRIRHHDGTSTLYAHLIENSTDHLQVGDAIVGGEIVGRANSTGGSTGNHLHLEYRDGNGVPVDPEACMDVPTSDFTGVWSGWLKGGKEGVGWQYEAWTVSIHQENNVVSGSITTIFGETASFSGSVQGTTLVFSFALPYGSWTVNATRSGSGVSVRANGLYAWWPSGVVLAGTWNAGADLPPAPYLKPLARLESADANSIVRHIGGRRVQ